MILLFSARYSELGLRGLSAVSSWTPGSSSASLAEDLSKGKGHALGPYACDGV
jgi:hypothetical protein